MFPAVLCYTVSNDTYRKEAFPIMAKRKFSGKRSAEKAENTEILAYRFRGYPDEETRALLWLNINHCRGFWNLMVSDWKDCYAVFGESVHNTPADYKDASGFEWLKDADSIALANVQQSFEKAVSAFFSGDAGMLKCKKKGRCRESYTTSCSNKKAPNLRLDGDMLKLPKISSSIKLNVHRKIKEGGILKSCTVSHDATGWYFSLAYEYPKTVSSVMKDPDKMTHTGLDMSIPHLYVDAEGNIPGFLKPYKALEKKLKREQKKLSRKERANISLYETKNGKRYPVYKRPLSECQNYQKQKARVALLHARIKHVREDLLHKLSAMLTDRYDVITVEDLNMKGIIRSLKLAKSASDIGWRKFVQMLSYKQERKGHFLIKTDRFFPSSKTCSVCGHVHKELKLSDRTYVCPVCGQVMDRDHQAAVNIDREGMRIFNEYMKELQAAS